MPPQCRASGSRGETLYHHRKILIQRVGLEPGYLFLSCPGDLRGPSAWRTTDMPVSYYDGILSKLLCSTSPVFLARKGEEYYWTDRLKATFHIKM